MFDTEALKTSVRRLNQLGYFKELNEETGITIDKTPGTDNQVDLTLKLEEQNRNQLTFGAGVSQYEGVFGQLAFQTANFMGRGESLTLSIQTGARARNYESVVHGAVPLRPADHGRGEHLQPRDQVHRAVHPVVARIHHHARVAAGGLHARGT